MNMLNTIRPPNTGKCRANTAAGNKAITSKTFRPQQMFPPPFPNKIRETAENNEA